MPPPKLVQQDSVISGMTICSALTGYGLAAMGALQSDTVEPRLLLPRDFSEVNGKRWIAPGWELGDNTYITL